MLAALPHRSFGREEVLASHLAIRQRDNPYEQPLVVPQEGQAKQLPARCICTPHW